MKKSKQERIFKRERRYFSEDFRRSRVKEIEQGQVSVSEISRVYHVSKTAIYKWVKKYSCLYQKAVVKVVEEKSEAKKRLSLEKQVKDLEQLIGQQQVRLEFYKKLVKMTEERYNIDIEKNSDWKSLDGFLSTDQNTI